jgi:hypothetical protein
LAEKGGLYWPQDTNGKYFDTKGVSLFAHTLMERRIDPHFNLLLQNALKNNNDVILSAEFMDSLDEKAIKLLLTLLTGFDITIVFVYRDFLSQLKSLYSQQNCYRDHANSSPVTFSTFLLKQMNQVNHVLKATQILKNYANVFGKEHVVAIDLAGTMAINYPIEKVIVCDIAGVLCSEPDLFGKPGRSNSHDDMVPNILFSLFKSHVKDKNAKSCRFCCESSAATSGCRESFNYILNLYKTKMDNMKLPTITSSLNPLRHYAKHLDLEFREQFGDRLLYGNETANYAQIDKTTIVDFDVLRFATSSYWRQWMEEQYEELLAHRSHNRSLLCNCTISK